MTKRMWLVVVMIGLLAMLACNASQILLGTSQTDAPSGDPPLVEVEPQIVDAGAQAVAPAETVLPPTAVPEPETQYKIGFGSPDGATVMDAQGTRFIELPVVFPEIYDYSPVTNRFLYATHFPQGSSGPGQLASSDLWLYDLNTGTATPIMQENLIVNALFAPDGQSFAYIIGAPATYELRWRAIGGEDKLLASDVPRMSYFSPSGRWVSIMRESGYEVDSTPPGLYIVDVNTGEERLLDPTNRAGQGSIADRVFWSPDEQYITWHVSGVDYPTGMRFARTDGTFNTLIGYDASLEGLEWYGMSFSSLAWHPDMQHMVVTLQGDYPDGGFGPAPSTHLVNLDLATGTITSITPLGSEGVVLGWNVPGQSVWLENYGDTGGISYSSVNLP